MPQGLLTVRRLIEALEQIEDKDRVVWIDHGEIHSIFQLPEGDYTFYQDGRLSDIDSETIKTLSPWLTLRRVIEDNN